MGTKGLILLADADGRMAPVMDLALHHLELPYQLAHLPNGKEVIRYLQGGGRDMEEVFPFPALVLLDLQIKRVDAIGVLRWIRKAPEARHLPVIVLAKTVFDPNIGRAYAAGANSFLVKASGYAAILAQLREIDEQWLRRSAGKEPPKKRGRRKGESSSSKPQASGETLNPNHPDLPFIQAVLGEESRERS
jgi:two-component system response regulator